MIYWTVVGTSIENMEIKQCTALLTPPIKDPSFEAAWQARVVGRHNSTKFGTILAPFIKNPENLEES